MFKSRNFKTIQRATVSAAAIALAGFGGAAIASAQDNGNRVQAPPLAGSIPQGAPVSFADLIESVSPAVVSIEVEAEVPNPLDNPNFNFDQLPPGFREFFEEFQRRNEGGEGEPRRLRGGGSGFFISDNGYVVTNAHVVKDATEITVTTRDGQELEGEVIGIDEPTDLAVVRVQGNDFPYVQLDSDPNMRVGDWVVAVGNPFGLGGTATAGIISATEREIGGQYNDFIQIDAPINRGNSGGPLFSLEGEVIGVNSQIFSPTGGNIGIGFAIPSDVASSIVSQLIEDGSVERGWLGVTIQSMDDDTRAALGLDEDEGAIIAQVVDGGPADEAGFEVGDVVLEVEGVAVEDATQLTREVGQLDAGQEARFRILRDGERRTLEVDIGERPSADELEDMMTGDDSSEEEEPESSSDSEEVLGVSLSPLDSSARQAFGLSGAEEGVVITDVDNGSEASRKGLRRGMLIREAGGKAVDSPGAVQAEIEAAREAGKSALLLLVQDSSGQQRFTALPLTEAESEDN